MEERREMSDFTYTLGSIYSTVQYSTAQYSTLQYSTVQYSTVQYSTVQYSRVQSQQSSELNDEGSVPDSSRHSTAFYPVGTQYCLLWVRDLVFKLNIATVWFRYEELLELYCNLSENLCLIQHMGIFSVRIYRRQ
jgi:hypothetical protein